MLQTIINRIEDNEDYYDIDRKILEAEDFPRGLSNTLTLNLFNNYKKFRYDILDSIFEYLDSPTLDYIVEENGIISDIKKLLENMIIEFFDYLEDNLNLDNLPNVDFFGYNFIDRNSNEYYQEGNNLEEKINLIKKNLTYFDESIFSYKSNIEILFEEQKKFNDLDFDNTKKLLSEKILFFMPINRGFSSIINKDELVNNLNNLKYFCTSYKIISKLNYKKNLDNISKTIPVLETKIISCFNIFHIVNKELEIDSKSLTEPNELFKRLKFLINITKKYNTVFYFDDNFIFKKRIINLTSVTDKFINRVYLLYFIFSTKTNYRTNFINIFFSYIIFMFNKFDYTEENNIKLLFYNLLRYRIKSDINYLINFIC